MKKNIKFIKIILKNSIILLSGFLVSISVFAGKNFSMTDVFHSDRFSFNAGTGVLSNSENNEVVFYDENSRLSQLDWTFDEAPIVQAGLNWNVLPWLNFNANGWTTLSHNRALMNNYDWTNEDNRDELTDWSYHPNTRLNFANQFDLAFEAIVLNQSHFKLGVLAGYQENRFSFSAVGGEYQHSLDDVDGNYIPNTALSDVGRYPDVKMATYKQKYKTPYVGLSTLYQFNKFELSTLLKFSPFVKAQDADHHVLQDTLFYTSSKNSEYYSASAKVSYKLVPNTSLYAEYSWNKYDLTVSDYHVVDNTNDDFYENSAGQASVYSHFGLGIRHKF